jgi:hypothetical protein
MAAALSANNTELSARVSGYENDQLVSVLGKGRTCVRTSGRQDVYHNVLWIAYFILDDIFYL